MLIVQQWCSKSSSLCKENELIGASSHTSRRRLWRSALSGSSSPRAERSAAACDLAARLIAVGKFFLRSWRHLQQIGGLEA